MIKTLFFISFTLIYMKLIKKTLSWVNYGVK